MSNISTKKATGASIGAVLTLTGNDLNVVSPDGVGNIDVFGDGTAITVVGNPGTNTITITAADALATSYVTDSGTAIPVGNILNVLGGTLISTSGAGDTATLTLDNGTDGQVILGSTAGSPAYAAITSSDASISFTLGANTLDMTVASAAMDLDFVTDSGTATSAAGIINVPGAHGLNTTGAGNTVTTAINNAITLGDLAGIAAGSDALTISTGDITFSATNNVGNLNMAFTVSADVGVVTGGSTTAITSGVRLFHTYNPNATGSNLFIGAGAGNFTLTTASKNVFIGEISGVAVTTAVSTTSLGSGSGEHLTSGDRNTFLGQQAGSAISSGELNTFVGDESGAVFSLNGGVNATGSGNATLGNYALGLLTTGDYNIAIGNGETASGNRHAPLTQLTTGSYNICIGGDDGAGTGGAGFNYTGAESSNICIGNATLGTLAESNVMRLGTTGSGDGQVDTCFIAGVHGVTPAGVTSSVVIDANGQLGTGGAGLVWSVETDAAVAGAVNTGYVANRAGLVTITLPTTAAVGSRIRVTGINTAVGWRLAQNAGETIYFGTLATTTGVGGYIEATAIRDSVEIVCVVADTDWNVLSSLGNITVV